MPCDCAATGIEEMFSDRLARREARRFRRRGLPPRSRKLVAAIRDEVDVRGATALEIGAGVGGITLTLLREGAVRASIVDVVPAYVAAARQLAADSGLAGSLELTVADYAVAPDPGEPFDVVVMDRVVCCYPDWRALLENAARDAKRLIALTYPRDVWWNRLGIRLINVFQRVRGAVFRVHLHSPERMRQALAAAGFAPAVRGRHGAWEILVAPRVTTA